LGQRLRAIRNAALAEGMPVMTQDEVLAEVRRRRGEPLDDD
jgi:rRNA-processing protein FCF1